MNATSTGATLYRAVVGPTRIARARRRRDVMTLLVRAARTARHYPRSAAFVGLVLLVLAPPALVLVPAVVALVAAGAVNGAERRKRGPQQMKVAGQTFTLNARRVWSGTALLAVLALLGAVLVPGRLVTLAVLVTVAVLVYVRCPAPAVEWWAERTLAPALVAAGIIRTRAGEPAPALSRRGQPVRDERGTAVTITLPPGVAAVEVEGKRVNLASALGVPARLLVVRHDPDDPANVVTLWVGFPQSAGSAASPLAAVERTSWADPVRIGCDEQGRPVTLQTAEQSSLVAGIPGAGKSSVCRIIVGHYLSDPAAQVYALDGKGSLDYAAAVPSFTRFVSGTSEEAPAELVAMLAEVLETVRARNNAGEVGPGLLLLLEELQDVRAAAGKRTTEQIDNLAGRIIRMGRAVGVHVLISTQRPSVEDVPSGVRNLITQRLCLMVRNPADAGLVLGTAPTLPLPTRRGEALLTTPASTRAVQLDLLDAAGWSAVVSRAGAARTSITVQRVGQFDPTVHGGAQFDPFGEAVRGLLRDGPLTATQMYAWLPAELQQGSVVGLGRALAQLPDVERGWAGKSPAWRLTAPRDSADLGMPHAQTGPSNPSVEQIGASAVQADIAAVLAEADRIKAGQR